MLKSRLEFRNVQVENNFEDQLNEHLRILEEQDKKEEQKLKKKLTMLLTHTSETKDFF